MGWGFWTVKICEEYVSIVLFWWSSLNSHGKSMEKWWYDLCIECAFARCRTQKIHFCARLQCTSLTDVADVRSLRTTKPERMRWKRRRGIGSRSWTWRKKDIPFNEDVEDAVNICWLCWYFRFPMISIVDVLVGALEHVLWLSIQLGISSSQVSFIFFRGVGWNHQPDDY